MKAIRLLATAILFLCAILSISSSSKAQSDDPICIVRGFYTITRDIIICPGRGDVDCIIKKKNPQLQ
ncbi:MAG: hypothetical protein KatS3mg033_0887 [Thermonema sp.]|nr:MAG: hypothetical protein KatS3mg033_0887 [Thermonema sp.]